MATRRRYGLQRVCRIWHVACSTVYAQRQALRAGPACTATPPRKRGPLGPCTDAVLVAQIRRILAASPFHGEGYRKVWAKLRFAGLRTSKERVRRLMRQHGLQVPQRVGHPHGPKAHDGTIVTEQPDVMWGTDATTTITLDKGQAYVFVSVDHCTFECTGLHTSAQGNGCAERFIRLLKENLLWVKSFATIEELRQALIAFKHQYNQQWILQRHDYKTRR